MPNAYTRTTTISLTEGERAELASMARSRSLPAALALRARIVLACEDEDRASTEVAQALGINRATVTKWRGRYARDRLAGLYDELRPGRPRTVGDERVVELINKTLHTNPARLVQERQGIDQQDRQLRQPVQRKLQAVRLGRHRRFNP